MIRLPLQASDALATVLKLNKIDQKLANKIKLEVNELLRYGDIPRETFFGILVRTFGGIASVFSYMGKGTFVNENDISKIFEEKPGYLRCIIYKTSSPALEEIKSSIIELDFINECEVTNISRHSSGPLTVYPTEIEIRFDQEKMDKFLTDYNRDNTSEQI